MNKNIYDKSCWACAYVSLGGNCFPGRCRWWVEAGKDKDPREIPVTVMDRGCKLWKDKNKGE